MESPVVHALTLQIAEDMVESCKKQCENSVGSKTILDLLDDDTMNRIITKIKDDDGRVKFKTNLFGFSSIKTAFNLIPNERCIEAVRSFLRQLTNPPELSAICASSCNVQFLCKVIEQTMKYINDTVSSHDKPMSVFVVINDTFELKAKSAGGRKQKSRGHTLRRKRHNRRSTRKH